MTIKICPTCKKPSLKIVSPPGSHDTYQCKDPHCPYMGSFFIEIDSDAVEQWGNHPDLKK